MARYWKHRASLLHLFSWILLIQGAAVLFYVFLLPSDPKNAWLLGLSKGRWGLLVGAVWLFLISMIPVLISVRKPYAWKQINERISERLEQPWLVRLVVISSVMAVVAGVWFFRFWNVRSGDQFLQAYLMRFAPFIFFLALTGLEILAALPLLLDTLKSHYLAFGFSIFCVGFIALFTNQMPVEGMPWDVKYYYLLAERGFEGQNIAPYVYRYATPFLARYLAEIFYFPIYEGYTILALASGVLQLFGVYWLVRTIGGGMRAALLAMATTALAMFNLKFLLFDISRPDHLAYFLMIMTVLALFSDRVILCTLISAAGLQFREHLAVPPFIMAVQSFALWWRRKKQLGPLLQTFFIAVVIGLAAILPRLLIPVVDNTQFVDIQKPESLINLIALPLDFQRDINFLFCTAAYLLPVLLMFTQARALRVWEKLRPHRFFLVLYTAIVLLLSLYGGHDMTRYSTYLFLPQAMAVAMLAKEDIPNREWVYMFFATVLFNRIFFHIPIPLEDTDKYLDFYAGYASRINVFSLIRWGEIVLYLCGAVLLRRLSSKKGETHLGRTHL